MLCRAHWDGPMLTMLQASFLRLRDAGDDATDTQSEPIVICVWQVVMIRKISEQLKRRRASADPAVGEEESEPTLQNQPQRRSPRKRSIFSRVQPVMVQDSPEVPVGDHGEQAETTFKSAFATTEGDKRYPARKEELLLEESQHASAWQQPARNDHLTLDNEEVEIKADAIIRKVREEDRLDPSIYGNLPGEIKPGPETRDMGGRFLINRARIDKSRLFNIARMLPKGAHLHLHFNSELRPDFLFPFARGLQDNFFIRTTVPLIHSGNFGETEIVFNVMPKDTIHGNVFSEQYDSDSKRPGTTAWMLWKDFREQFPAEYRRCYGEDFKSEEHLNEHHSISRKPALHRAATMPLDPNQELEPAELWATEKMVITQDLKYKRACTHNEMWACFNQGTRAFKGLLNYASIYRAYIGNAIDHMIGDGVMYAELRPMLMDKSIPTDDGNRSLDHRAQMNILLEEVAKKHEKMEAEGNGDLFPFGLKIIYCAPRSIPKARMRTELQDCLKLALQFREKNLICGFDLVGAEDRPNNIGFYADELLAFRESCEKLKLNIPFMFHAGETLLDTGGSDDPTKSNLYDAWLLDAKRIGHGYSILKHPMLIEKYRPQPPKKGESKGKEAIALELCPISNELLGLCGNAREHPYPALLAAGLHCTLNADNPSLFSSSLSHEFYQVMVGDTRMSLFGWRQLAEWSIQHSCLPDDQKKRGLELLRERWRVFCKWVVDNDGTEFIPEMSA